MMKCPSKLICFIKLLLIIQIFSSGTVFSQNKGELEKKKLENIKELQYSKGILDKMSLSKKSSMNQVNLLQKNIEVRKNLVDIITEEIKIINTDIDFNNGEIVRINKRIESLKNEYAELIKNSYKMLDKEYSLMYILSSQDINQGYMRMKYIKYLTEYRKSLISALDSEKLSIQILNRDLSRNKLKNEQLLSERRREIQNMDSDKKKNLSLIQNLQKKESELKKEIKRREKIMAQIDNELKRLIEEEIRKSKAAKRLTKLSTADMALAADFSKNQGKLPWPIDKGIITGKYGVQHHKVLKGIVMESDGIDISTEEGSVVHAVFNGEVTRVVGYAGYNSTILIRHGDFYTVYMNLINVKVKIGDKVKTGDIIGTVFTNQDNESNLHFQIRKDRITLNPELWLKMIGT